MAALTQTNIPTCLWAQRKDCVYVTVDVPDCKDEEITVADDKLTFKGTSKDKQYACEMVLLGIKSDGSKYAEDRISPLPRRRMRMLTVA